MKGVNLEKEVKKRGSEVIVAHVMHINQVRSESNLSLLNCKLYKENTEMCLLKLQLFHLPGHLTIKDPSYPTLKQSMSDQYSQFQKGGIL